MSFPGAYAPLTLKGNIIIDDVLASCYASVHHDLAHIGMIPIRRVPDVTDWILGHDEKSSAYITIFQEWMEWLLLY